MLGSIAMSLIRKDGSLHTLHCHTFNMLKRHAELVILLILLMPLLAYQRAYLRHPATLLALVDWETIATLAGIILATTAVRQSHLFGRLAAGILSHIRSERALALVLTSLTAGMATFLTNDIALLIIVPLTLSLQDFLEEDITKMVVFEALAANVGSALTPIGNPQNLFLWHQWGLHFAQFVSEMAAPVGLMLTLLIALIWLAFHQHSLTLKVRQNCHFKPRLAALSLAALGVYIVLAEFRFSIYAFLPLLAFFFMVDREAIRQADWALAGLFILMFVDFHLLAAVPVVEQTLHGLQGDGAGTVFLGSILASQVISNVPAAILVSQFSHAWRAIAYGVNLGGNGLFIGSLANLIALKMVGNRRIWRDFHLYSLPYLAVTAALVYFILL